ncbi:photosynthetic protein synthase I, partial [Vibrio xuii]
MSKNWSLILVVAFVLGFGVKTFLDSEPAATDSQTQQTILFGQDNQPVDIFDPNDSRVRVVYFGFTRCPDVCPTSLAMLAGALNQTDE